MSVKMILAMASAALMAACSGGGLPTTGGYTGSRHAAMTTVSSGAYDEVGDVMMPAAALAEERRMASAMPAD
jgi:hypothetical protein